MGKMAGSVVFFALFAACMVLLSGCTESGQGAQQGDGGTGGFPAQGARDGNHFRGYGDGNRFRGAGDANRFRDMNGMGGFPGGRDANMMRGLPPGIAAGLGLPEGATQAQINAALGLPADATVQQAWQAMRKKGLMPSAPPAQGNGGA